MSECKWCDVCDTPFPESDVDARAIQEQIPELRNGVKISVVTVERHQCGRCTRRQAQEREARRLAIEAGADE